MIWNVTKHLASGPSGAEAIGGAARSKPGMPLWWATHVAAAGGDGDGAPAGTPKVSVYSSSSADMGLVVWLSC